MKIKKEMLIIYNAKDAGGGLHGNGTKAGGISDIGARGKQ